MITEKLKKNKNR